MKIYIVVLSTLLLSWPSLAGNSKSQKAEDCPLLSSANLQRLGRELRLSYANQFMAQDRETVNEAYAGDIVGIIDTGYFQIGDTITSGHSLSFGEMPRFSPEVFAKLHIKDPLKRKQLEKASLQLAEEGMIQLFYDSALGRQDPILGVVGELQLDVLLHRLNGEYKLNVKLERQVYSVARWVTCKESHQETHKENHKNHKKNNQRVISSIQGGTRLHHDIHQNPVVLLEREWDLKWLSSFCPERPIFCSLTLPIEPPNASMGE